MSNTAEELASTIREFQSRFKTSNDTKLPEAFELAAHRFLSEHLGDPHAFAPHFNTIAPVPEFLADAGRFHEALSVWEAVRRVIARWEDANEGRIGFRPVHMGTPF